MNGGVNDHVGRPIDGRTTDQRGVGLANVPSGKGSREARVRLSRLGHENNARRSRVETMVHKHPMADVLFNQAGETRPIHVECLVSGKSCRFVDGDQPLVFKEDAETRSRSLLGKPVEGPDKDRRPFTQHQIGVANNRAADGNHAGDEGFPGEAPGDGSLEMHAELICQPAIQWSQRIFPDHDRERLHLTDAAA